MPQERKIAIITDSSCDLSDEQLVAHGVRMISLRIVCQDGEYRDRVEMSNDELYERMDSEVPKSSLPLPEDVEKLYTALAEEGTTDVIHICISSGLSGTYNMVRMIAADFENRMNIRVVDSLTLSTGLGMQVLVAARAIEAGAEPDEAVRLVREARSSQLGMFVIRTLEYLRKGGRIGLVEGVVGTILQLKPVIFVNDDGIYQTKTKARGYRNAVEAMVQETVARFGDAKISLSVVHGQALEEAQTLMERLKRTLNIVDSFISPVSPVLAIHTGRGLLGIVAHRV